MQVLTTGYWPTYTQLDVVLPPEMNNCLNVRSLSCHCGVLDAVPQRACVSGWMYWWM